VERPVSIDSLKIVPPDRRSLAALGMTWWGVTNKMQIDLLLCIMSKIIVTPHHVIPSAARDLLSGGTIFKESIDTGRSTLGSMH